MGESMARVEAAAQDLDLDISIKQMPDTTRTAQEAAEACECTVGQIIKSLIFEGAETGKLKLLLVSGAHDVKLDQAKALFGEDLQRADPRRVRKETGFAIGGVSPIGHLTELESWMDTALLQYETVWAAAGAPHAVFSIDPKKLQAAIQAQAFDNG